MAEKIHNTTLAQAYRSLAVACQIASKPNRLLEVKIYSHFGEIDERHVRSWTSMDGRTDLSRDDYLRAWALRYTSDLEHIVALIERDYPSRYLLGKGRLTPREPLFGAIIYFGTDSAGERGAGESNTNLSLAACAAYLDAKARDAE